MKVLILDVGTSSMRGVLCSEKGEMICKEQICYTPKASAGGRVEQKPEEFIGALVKIIRSLSLQTEDVVEAVAVTAQRSSVIPVDCQGMPLCDAIMWQDTRDREICRELEPYQQLAVVKSGAKINPVFSGAKMAWIKRKQPKIAARVFKFLNIPEYLIYYMTGEYCSDYTYGSRSNLMNLRTHTWDQELLSVFGVEEKELCRLLPPGSICGVVTKSFAEQVGLKAGIPVITCGGDQQCAAVGQGVMKEGDMSVVTGTGGFLVAACEKAPKSLNQDLICNCSSIGNYILEANVLTCCSAFDWFLRNFYGQADYTCVERELREQKSEIASCMVLPYFQGRSTPDWNAGAQAVFAKVTLAIGRKEMLKALLEGIALEIQNNLRIFREYTAVSRAYISGGLTNSNAFNQIQADVYGIPLYRMENTESTVLGAFIVAMCGLGIYQSPEKAFGAVREQEKITSYLPTESLHLLYEEKRRQMNQLYQRIYGQAKEWDI